MARSSNRRREIVRSTRRPSLSLGHTVDRFRRDSEPYQPLPIRQGFFTHSASPLIRTVLPEPAPPVRLFPKPGIRSALIRTRATGRSSDRVTRSPFNQAVMLSPELTQRAIICAKRTIRKEVLFATKRTGKGSKSPRRSPSKVRC